MMGALGSGYNLDLIEAEYQRWRRDPKSVEESWRSFFAGFELGLSGPPRGADSSPQVGVIRLIFRYRSLGHLCAHLDPLSDPPEPCPVLGLDVFGLGDADLERSFDFGDYLGMPGGTLKDLVAALRETYCRTIGVEYMHVQDTAVRRWLQERMEPRRNRPEFTPQEKRDILTDLHHAESFEKFLHTRFLGQKRFSLEGAETLIPLMDRIVESAADRGVLEIVLGMAHRGRLNVLANLLGKPYKEIFTEFDAHYIPDVPNGDGDVKYHLGYSRDRATSTGKKIHLTLTPNPSHLEVVNGVVEGRSRAKQDDFKDTERVKLLPLLIHGDAAFAAQGMVAEALNLSQLEGYTTGGTIHLIINNQIGFTTRPADARSSRYCTDVAKMIDAPIFHVNCEDPEAVLYVGQLAVEFRQTFHRDIVIDLVCYRKHGHNEGDEPAYTNPVMYAKIAKKPLVSKIYAQQLIDQGILDAKESQEIANKFLAMLDLEQEQLRKQGDPVFSSKPYLNKWSSIRPDYTDRPTVTGVPYDLLKKVSTALSSVPEGFEPHPKLKKELLTSRYADVHERRPIAWGLAESLAFGSLLAEGTPIRLTGQDTRRGTFSQRHAVLFDHRTDRVYVPLQHVDAEQAPFSVYDSLLSEVAVVAFEFGFALDSPNTLVLWEAQFGAFGNGAQVVIDQYLASSKSKWQRDNGLVLLLPHGYDGQGPEHSSARLERFLQLCAENNLQVVYPTTPAQYFHLLRRQMRAPYRRPLIVMTPKSMLRNKHSFSDVDQLTEGTQFHEVLDDPAGDKARAERIILCSGKVYYDLVEQRARNANSAVILRLEQLYPFPAQLVERLLNKYPRGHQDIVWVQEESHNMGAWFFIEPRLRKLGFDISYIGRDDSASPATGSSEMHKREQRELVRAAFEADGHYLISSESLASDERHESAEDNGVAESKAQTVKQ